MPTHSPEALRLRLALDMAEAGREMVRQRLRRENPDASEAVLAQLFREWALHRPGSEHGDGPAGRVRVHSSELA